MQRSLNRDSNVLLSGATGLIGGELLRALTARVDRGTIWAVVRPTADQDPAARLAARLARSGAAAPPPNARAVPGDVVARDWGLPPADLADVAARADFI